MTALLTPHQAAARLGLPYRTVLTAIKAQQIPAVPVGKQWRVPVDALDEWLKTADHWRHPKPASLAAQRVKAASERRQTKTRAAQPEPPLSWGAQRIRNAR